jgi:hypothetical protein
MYCERRRKKAKKKRKKNLLSVCVFFAPICVSLKYFFLWNRSHDDYGAIFHKKVDI